MRRFLLDCFSPFPPFSSFERSLALRVLLGRKMASLLVHCAIAAIILVSMSFNAGEAVTISLNNSCPFTVWPGWLSGEGGELLQGGGKLDPWRSMQLEVPKGWGGRFWGRTGCYFDSANGRGTCETGDCGNELGCGAAGGVPPVTLAEFKLDGFNNNDFYDVSLVDGYNLPMRVSPASAKCAIIGCHSDVNANCPKELQLRSPSGGHVVGCKSACEAFQTDAFCCRGAHSQSQSCSPTQYSKMFKQHCPQAYSYAYDDLSSTFTCASGSGYVIEFCPSGNVDATSATSSASGVHHQRAHRRLRDASRTGRRIAKANDFSLHPSR